jgi:large subunit ribosomal protein L16
MKFNPKHRKFKKTFKLRFKSLKSTEHKTTFLQYGNYGIKALSVGILTSKHFSSLQLIIKRTLKKKGLFWFRKLPYTFSTKKPLEVRMGKGKGNHDQWICPIFTGQIILEFQLHKISLIESFLLFRRCIKRLPVKATIISLYRTKLNFL